MFQEANKLIRLYPHSHPDELFASRASRYHWEIGGLRTKDTYAELFGKMPGRLTQIIPPHLWVLAKKLPGDSQENLKKMLYGNTLFPICALFYGLDLAGVNDQESLHDLHLPRRTFTLTDTKICLACVRDDYKVHGIPYLHRSHQVPGVRVCHHHAHPLLEVCPYCDCPFEVHGDLFTVPWRPCKCDRMLIDMPIQDAPFGLNSKAVEYAIFAHSLLNDVSFVATPLEISETYRHRLIQLGFARGKGISHKAAIEAIEEYYGKDELSELDKAYKEGKLDQWLRLIHSAIMTQEVPISRHIILANFLFDSAEEFVKELNKARKRINNKIDHGAPVGVNLDSRHDSVQSEKTKKFVDKVIQTINANPGFSMKQLWKKLPGTLGKILKSDPDEFEKIQKLISDKTNNGVRERLNADINARRKDSEIDTRNAESLKRAATLIFASIQKPKRVTKSEMLRTAKLDYRHSNNQLFPLSAQIIEEYAESSWHFWARRYVWAHVQARDKIGTMDILKLSGVHRYHYRELASMFSNLKIPKQLKEGQIVAILAAFGIGHKWGGPCPEKSIVAGGRAYQKVKASSENKSLKKRAGKQRKKQDITVSPAVQSFEKIARRG